MSIHIHALLIAVVMVLTHITLVFCLMNKVIINKLSPIVIHVLSGFLVLLLLLFFDMVHIYFNVWLAFSIFVFAASFYLFLFSAVYKSLSIRFLLLISSRSGKTSYNELDALITDNSFYERIELLYQMGLVLKEGDIFKISDQGMHVASRIERIRKLFNIKTTGLYQEH